MTNDAKIEIEIDCNNFKMSDIEELWFQEHIADLVKSRGMSVKSIKIFK
jgi:hypothetical protein